MLIQATRYRCFGGQWRGDYPPAFGFTCGRTLCYLQKVPEVRTSAGTVNRGGGRPSAGWRPSRGSAFETATH